ncbi:hypothetical protein KJY73_20725 [Bowmanella sp. Y26]|uniref:hypothetical protein n=1 Tax=Bowmanella yangjiangensis TaxID=2811230 RepID=UPI001BDDC1DB|nr:hypothetical protein [Bowmanella yangjiangensis]MBT1066011.1 hypothetical protein [Bowmanella yangjiangensis]
MAQKKVKKDPFVYIVESDDAKGLNDFVEIFEKASAGDKTEPILRKSYETERLRQDAKENRDI